MVVESSLNTLKNILIEKYSADIKNSSLEDNVLLLDFVADINVSSHDFSSMKSIFEEKSSYYIIFTGISGISDNRQRITAKLFETEAKVCEYLHSIEQMKEYDHKVLGRDMKIFTLDQNALGLPFWLKNGTTMIRIIEDYIDRSMHRYERVSTPIMANIKLWESSGHFDMYKDNMFIFPIGNEEYAIKPMSCPLHVELIKKRKLYKADLPLRLAEFGRCHRNEASGGLNGLFRVRSITQDDAHIFCTESQIEEMVNEFCEMLIEIYKNFGFNKVEIFLATRPEKFIGEIDAWDKAEAHLTSAIKKAGHSFSIKEGDGAFYGPKLEFHITDNMSRLWQCGTVQLDFMMAERLDLYYTDECGAKKNPVIIHHAILGSIERFIGILLEQCKGWLPIWVAPIQILLIPIKSDINIENIVNRLVKNGIRYTIDESNNSLTDRVKKACEQKIPIVAAIGNREISSDILPVRLNGAKEIMIETEKLIAMVLESKP